MLYAQYPPDTPVNSDSDIHTCLTVQEGSITPNKPRPIPSQERFSRNTQGFKESLATEVETACNFGRVLPEAKPKTQSNGELLNADAGSEHSRFWAVLIGIDGYTTYPLRGCVADALTVEQYLVKDLLVPRERTQKLLGPASDTSNDVSSIPTRANIISLLLSLPTNPNINHGDPIIIFFAGHGSRYPLSDDDDDDDPDFGEHEDDKCPSKFVEALCPIDRNILDSNGAIIPDITDRELNAILKQISYAKGNRITFILDCCHAGSVTRTLSPGVRTVPPLERVSLKDMLLTAGEAFRGLPGDRSMLAKDWVADTDSHVIVAACRGNEIAKAKREKGTKVWGGVFTNLLIKTLRSGALGARATYVELIEALPKLDFQTPIVAGGRVNTRLWYQV